MTGTAFITAENEEEAREKMENEQYDDILFEQQVGDYAIISPFEESDE